MSNDNTKLYTVYRLYNIVTNRSYIGMTHVKLRRRKVQHMSDLKHSRHSSEAMQSDYEEYGRATFKIEPIKTGLTELRASELERYYIDLYDATIDGYNKMDGGLRIPFTWNGITYRSITEASEKLGVGVGTIYHRIENNHTCDDDLANNQGIACVWNGITYRSINAAAKACGISHPSMVKRLDKGYTCDEDMARPPYK